MNLRDLEYVVAVADSAQFGLAAERCGVSQPTLSMQIRKLEEQLGLVLFERTARGAVPTAAGVEIVAQARVVLDEADRIVTIARWRRSADQDVLRLGVIPTAAPYLLPLVLPQVKQMLPRLRLQLREAITERLLAQIRAMALDAVVLSPPFDTVGLLTQTLGREAFLVAMPLDHPLAGKAGLGPVDLAGETVLVLEDGHCFREQALTLSRQLHLVPAHEIRAGSIESLRQMVSVGMGCAILPALAMTGPFAAGAPVAIRPIEHPGASRELTLVWRRSYPRGESLRIIAESFSRALGGAAVAEPAR